MKQCINGHFFDDSRYASCPYCQGGSGGDAFGNGAGYSSGVSGGVGKTMAAMPAPAAGDIGKTMAVMPSSASGSTDAGKTVGILPGRLGFDPAVGFLVCIEGPHRGSDYKLSPGRNFIGRSISSAVALVDDDSVSREDHCTVTYDSKHNSFSISPGTGSGLSYINDDLVEMPRKLKAYDVIEVGKSKLIFLPLCGEHFRWEEGEGA